MTRTQAQALAAADTDTDLAAARIRMGEALPADGWLDVYLRAVTPLTDAPVEFHLAAGLAAVGAAIGNRLWVESWGQNVFPHLWVVLVAPSSFWRKSTAINTAERILHAAAPTKTYPSDFSREKLLGVLEERPAGMLTLKEFGGFLAALNRDYMGGTKETLTELYDGPDEFTRALKSGVITVKRPAITLLAATTLDWLESRITEGDLRGGFLGRFLFVTARQKATAKGLTQGMDVAAKLQLIEGLHELHERAPGQVEYGPGAREELDAWMAGWEGEVESGHHRSDLSGFAVRLQTYALKLAMIYGAAATAFEQDGSDTVVDVTAVRQAISYCRLLWTNVTGLIDDDIAITKEAQELRRIRGIIGSGITRSEALKLSKLKARDFDMYLDTLQSTGEVVIERRQASDLGLDRVRNSSVQWLAVHHANGHGGPVAVPFGLTGIPRELEPEGTPREPEGPDPRTNSPSSSSSLTLSIPNESTRARGRKKRTGGELVTGELQGIGPSDDDDPESFL